MPRSPEDRAPAVFISYASADRAEVLGIHQDLIDRGVDPFLDIMDIDPGDDFVMGINRALETSDFYVLIWSAAARDRYWVDREIAAAMVQERRLGRPFVFIMRIDESDLPLMLAPRRFLDAFDGRRQAAVDELAALWRRDRTIGAEVLIAPVPAPEPRGRPVVHVYARNRSLSVAHDVDIPVGATAREVVLELAGRLALPSETSEYGGVVGVRFEYRYTHDGADLDPDSDELPELADLDVIDIEVIVEPFGPNGALAAPISFLPGRGGDQVLPPGMVRALCLKAFRHLLPDARPNG